MNPNDFYMKYFYSKETIETIKCPSCSKERKLNWPPYFSFTKYKCSCGEKFIVLPTGDTEIYSKFYHSDKSMKNRFIISFIVGIALTVLIWVLEDYLYDWLWY
ncbi:MAG: hypothetical protein COA79_22410 [Planctomycetota bacterium]|nr:MAG: hypothetical protein COA79_22410 [Planctomycetota bacterium]